MKIGKKIHELRKKKDMTQRELAKMIGVTPSAVGNYEQGISFPREEILYRLFTALNCSPNELFGYESQTTAIAARNGGGEITLKKRGKKSIFDAPDYK